MLSTLYLLSLSTASAATTLLTLDEVSEQNGSQSNCLSQEAITTTTTAELYIPEETVVDLTDFALILSGQHGICGVTLDEATLTLDGTALWSQPLDLAGSGAAETGWYVEEVYSRSDVTRMRMAPGTHTLTLQLWGTAESIGEAIRAQLVVDTEYGRDWDDDGYTSDLLAGGEDCDDRDPTVYPGAPELDDSVDNDCDGEVDEDIADDEDDEPDGSGDTGSGDTGSGDTGSGDTGSGDTGNIVDDDGVTGGQVYELYLSGGGCSTLPGAAPSALLCVLGALFWRRRR